MKLPRWLVIGMLASSVLLVLVAAGWWWVTWPERTAREFAELLAAGKWAEIQRMSAANPGEGYVDEVFVRPDGDARSTQPGLQPVPRSLLNHLLGRQAFWLGGKCGFVIVRGKLQPPRFTFDSSNSIIDIDGDGLADIPLVPSDSTNRVFEKRGEDESK